MADIEKKLTGIVTEKDKWGKIDGGLFVGEALVPLMIALDKQNPVKQRIVCINGNQIWLGVGKPLIVPQSVASEWNNSYVGTMDAEERMSQSIEINMD